MCWKGPGGARSEVEKVWNPDGLAYNTLIQKYLCPDAVINLCSCGYPNSAANRQQLANETKRKVCSCDGDVNPPCHCIGNWECSYPAGKDASNYGK